MRSEDLVKGKIVFIPSPSDSGKNVEYKRVVTDKTMLKNQAFTNLV